MNNPQRETNHGPRNMLPMIMRVVAFLIPALIYLPTFGGNAAVPPGASAYSDLLITHYPNSLYLQKSLMMDHQIPLWSSMIQSGAPFAANPLAGVFYLPGWLALLFPLPGGLSVVLAAHVVFGTWGMYKFLGEMDLSQVGRFLGALSFGLLPKMAAHFAAGHVTLLYALAWTPWILYSSEKDRRGWVTGVLMGMIFLADPRWMAYAGAFWLTYDIAHRQRSWKAGLLYYLKTGSIALLISAPLLVPLLEYVKLATRNTLSSSDMLNGSLPVPNLMNAIIPGSGGNTEWYFYLGGALLALVLNRLLDKKFLGKHKFWFIWFVLSLFMAIGPGSDALDWLAKIPLLNLLRVPARSLFLAGLCMAVIGAYAVDDIGVSNPQSPKQRIINFSIITLGLMMIAGIIYLIGAQPIMLVWGFVFFTLGGILILVQPAFPGNLNWQWLMILLLVIDFLVAGFTSYTIQAQDQREPAENLAAVIAEGGYFRIYSPSYSVPQYLAAEYDLELVDGVDPLQIASYVDFVQEATGVPQEEYSVTIPPFRTGDPSQDNQLAKIDSKLLGLLNVRYVVSEFELQAPGLAAVSRQGSPKIYQNRDLMPRAWVEIGDQSIEKILAGNFMPAEIIDKTANTLLIQASGPGKLVVSEIYYPGWQVLIDGMREEIHISHNIFRSVSLPEGDHQILFRFCPISVYAGLGLACLGWIGLGLIMIRIRLDRLSS